MFFELTSELPYQPNYKGLKGLKIELDAAIEQLDAFLDECGISLDAIVEYFSNEENFAPEVWELLESHRHEHERANEEKKAVANPVTTRQRYEERKSLDPRWLFVR